MHPLLSYLPWDSGEENAITIENDQGCSSEMNESHCRLGKIDVYAFQHATAGMEQIFGVRISMAYAYIHYIYIHASYHGTHHSTHIILYERRSCIM